MVAFWVRGGPRPGPRRLVEWPGECSGVGSTAGRENGMCKGPEVGISLVWDFLAREVRVAGLR